MDTNNFTYFVLLNHDQSSYSIVAQFVDKNGESHQIVTGKDKFQNPIYRRFRWTQQNRTIRIPNKQEEEIEFLRLHPLCEGSPNNTSGSFAFKELNDKKAAELALAAKRLRSKAETLALSLSTEELAEFAILVGSDHTEPSLQAHAVAEYAGSNPPQFIELYDDPARKARALFSKAKIAGVIKNKGFMVFWENIHLGNGEEEAIKKIFGDEQLSKALTAQLKKQGAY